MADLRAGGALDGLLVRFRGGLLDIVHPVEPRRARDRAAGIRFRVSPPRAPRRGANPCGDSLRVGLGANPVLHGDGRGRGRGRQGARRQRGRRSRDELAQSALAGDGGALRGNRRVPVCGVPRERCPACRRARSRALLRHTGARLRNRGRRARGRRPRRTAQRGTVRLRRPHGRRVAARDSLGSCAGRRFSYCFTAGLGVERVRLRSAPSPR